MFVFELPEIGEGVLEGEIQAWHVSVGDMVAVDQPLCEVLTDKAAVEISSPTSGRIAALHAAPGDIVPVHTAIVEIDESGGAAAPPPPRAQPASPPVSVPQPAPAAASPAPATDPAPLFERNKTLATPAVRSHARSMGVDIALVPGSGKDGRVTRADVDSFQGGVAPAQPLAASNPVAPVRAPAFQLPGATFPRPDERIRIIGLRRKIAEKMVQSATTIPHFTYVDEVDVTRLVDLRTGLKPDAEAMGVKLTFMAFFMKACAVAFREFPTLNARMDEENFELVVKGQVNIGIATDTPAGLYVPVVKDVQSKSVLQLARDVADVVARTRAGKASMADFSDGTFTITGVGSVGGRFATPIINHPEVAILGVNEIHDQAVVRDGQIVARKVMYLSSSFDHRVIDGAVAARFTSHMKAILQRPEQLLWELA